MARILIVDDSPTGQLELSKMLEKHGHEIFTAADGEEGVTTAAEQIPDLILMDIVMPKLNGFQATRKITQNESTSHIPVVLVTTKNQETDRMWGKRQGAKGYLVKPVEEDTILSTLNDLLPA